MDCRLRSVKKMIAEILPDGKFRVYLKTGNVTDSEEFFRYASHFNEGILEVFRGKRTQHSGKRAAARVR